jgi:sugar/nucleoside kinase (ribokinase family)
MRSGDVVVIGSVAYDDIQTPLESRRDVLGGSATYFSLAAARLCTPHVVAVVGEDFRSEDKAFLLDHGVDLAGLACEPGQCFRWGGRYLDDFMQRETLYTHLNVFAGFQPRVPPALSDCRFVALGNIDPDLQLRVLDAFPHADLVVADTMNFWITGKRPVLDRLLSHVDVLMINDEEARLLAARRNLVSAIREVGRMGPRALVVKKGEHGAVLYAQDAFFAVPAFPVEQVVDPTGAGDTFAGGFVGYLASLGHAPAGDELRQAMLVGTTLASIAVEGFGPSRLATVTREELRRRHAALVQMLQVERREEWNW